MEKTQSEVHQQIRSTQEEEVSPFIELQKKLDQEITELKRRDSELQKISQAADDSQFLHKFSSLPALSKSPDSSSLEINPLRHFEDVTEAVAKLRDEIQQVLREALAYIPLPVGSIVFLNEPEPNSREDFLRYSCQVTLNPNTVNKHLLFSEENRKVTFVNKVQSYCDYPDRFMDCYPVLSVESLIGQCYWEVERRGKWVGTAVTYRNISRSGWSAESGFGSNKKSWRLVCSSGG